MDFVKVCGLGFLLLFFSIVFFFFLFGGWWLWVCVDEVRVDGVWDDGGLSVLVLVDVFGAECVVNEYGGGGVVREDVRGDGVELGRRLDVDWGSDGGVVG